MNPSSPPLASRIDLCSDVGQFFRDVVGGVRAARDLPATEAATDYVVALLVDYADPNRYDETAFDRPLTFLLHDALGQSGPGSFQKLRQLGDVVLYLCGFFGEHFEKRGVTKDYVAALGAQAYWGARRKLTGFGAADDGVAVDLFYELAGNFESFVVLLEGVAWDLPGSKRGNNTALLEIYERWLSTGSTRLGAELASVGLLPQRGDRTVH